MPKVSAYIPCYNNESSIAESIKSVLNQNSTIDQFFVIDDGSTDNSVNIIQSLGVEVIQNKINQGRGWVRHTAMKMAKHDFVLCCDAGKSLHTDFIQKALPWFENNKIASVYGSLSQSSPINAAERWRGIYLYREREILKTINTQSTLITFATIVRKSAVMKVGNFDPQFRHSEDIELGTRLVNSGYITMSDANLKAFTLESCSSVSILRRYWRWNAGTNEEISIKAYIKNISYSIKVMLKQDIEDYDFKRAFISLICPHFQFWYTILRKVRND